MSEAIARVNGLDIAYESFGDEKHPAILLIMGLGTQMIAWSQPFIDPLVARGYRVIRFDNRDIGLSAKIEGKPQPSLLWLMLASRLGLPLKVPYRLDDMAADAVGLMDVLGIDRAHVAGASMGGMIAQLVAANYPDRSLSLTSIMSSSGRRGLPSARWAAQKQLLIRPKSDDEATRVAHSVRTYQVIGSPGFPMSEERLREKSLAAYRRSNYAPGYFRQLCAIAASGPRVAKLQTIQTPTLVLHGRDDPLVPLAHGEDTARWIPGAKLQVIDGWGHDLPDDLCPELARQVADHADASAD